MRDELTIIQSPPAVDSINLLENTALLGGGRVGTFYIRGTPLGSGESFFVETAKPLRDFEINLRVVEEFSVQLFPTFNPFLLLVFNTTVPRNITDGIPFLFACGYDITASATNAAYYDASSKLVLGNNTFNGNRLPGDFKKFKAWNYISDTAPPDSLFTLWHDTGANGPNQSRSQSMALLKFYGH